MLLSLIFFGRNTVDTLLTKGWAFGKGNTFTDTTSQVVKTTGFLVAINSMAEFEISGHGEISAASAMAWWRCIFRWWEPTRQNKTGKPQKSTWPRKTNECPLKRSCFKRKGLSSKPFILQGTCEFSGGVSPQKKHAKHFLLSGWSSGKNGVTRFLGWLHRRLQVPGWRWGWFFWMAGTKDTKEKNTKNLKRSHGVRSSLLFGNVFEASPNCVMNKTLKRTRNKKISWKLEIRFKKKHVHGRCHQKNTTTTTKKKKHIMGSTKWNLYPTVHQHLDGWKPLISNRPPSPYICSDGGFSLLKLTQGVELITFLYLTACQTYHLKISELSW